MRNLLLILLTFLPFVSLANDKISLDSLDRVLNNRDHYLSAKQRAIANAESKLSMASNPNDQLKALQELYNQYYTFRFDSAMVKVEKMHQLAHQSDRKDYQALSDTYKAELLATTGLFHEALQTLEGVNRSDVADEHLTDYYKVYEWTYSMLAEYAEGSNYADQYYQKEMAYQDSILSTLTPETALYNYWMAENLYRKGMFERAARYYKKAQGSASPGTRLYSQVTFGLALCATQLDNPNDRRNYLIMAAIGDQICPLKENLALQTLALDLASEDKDNLAQANKYLRYSLEDAMFFNDRLRLMEISRKVPDIVHNYEKGLESSNSTKTAFLWVCIIATLLLLAATIFGFSERNKLKRSQQKLDASYSKLSEAKAQLEESHTQLVDTHAELKGQKKLKEDCIRLFMDITAAYIYKLNMFHMTVQRKIKANQAQPRFKGQVQI